MSKTEFISLGVVGIFFWVTDDDFETRLNAPAPAWLVLALAIAIYHLWLKGADDAKKGL